MYAVSFSHVLHLDVIRSRIELKLKVKTEISLCMAIMMNNPLPSLCTQYYCTCTFRKPNKNVGAKSTEVYSLIIPRPSPWFIITRDPWHGSHVAYAIQIVQLYSVFSLCSSNLKPSWLAIRLCKTKTKHCMHTYGRCLIISTALQFRCLCVASFPGLLPRSSVHIATMKLNVGSCNSSMYNHSMYTSSAFIGCIIILLMSSPGYNGSDMFLLTHMTVGGICEATEDRR